MSSIVMFKRYAGAVMSSSLDQHSSICFLWSLIRVQAESRSSERNLVSGTFARLVDTIRELM